MNRIHRLVWNQHTGVWVAVAETARSRGKGSGRAARKALLAVLMATGLTMSQAMAEQAATTVVPATGKTNAYISANGVPVVNIETANAKGLSHNYFTRYDVETIGMVLNNGNNALVSRQSQLAGQVISNLNLVQEAKVILNEVVSTNRSTLAGFTEVLGGKADVIVANPNGITCNGCGFINTDRATLTTGTSNVAADGSLTGFTVNRGDVLIEGLGANASTQQIFDIVARSVKVDGQINTAGGGSLGITTGNNTWDYTSRSVTGNVAGSGAAPAYAIDSTALGGMYAGRIRLIATEAGVGVRMLGEAAASTDDFTLSSAGKIEIQSTVSAARDANITTTAASGNQDMFLNGANAKVSANRDLAVTATFGQIKLVEGELYAANNVTLSGATLSDVSTAAKTRFAGVNSTFNISGATSIDGGVWGAGSALSGSFDSLTIGSGSAKVYAGTTLGLTTVNNMSLGTAGVRSAGNMTLTANNGTISTTAGASQGVQTTAGNLTLTAGNGLTNAGTITADAGSVTARINGTLNNSGTLNAKTILDLADKTNGSTVNVTNSGTMLADGSIAAKAASLTNQASGKIQGTAGTTVTAMSLTNAGTFIASNTGTQSGTFTLASLNNSGTLQSAKDLTFNITGTLANSGKLLATDSLSVQAGSAALAISNTSPGVIQAGNGLTFNGSNATFNTQSGTVLGNTVNATLASLVNSGMFQSSAGMTLSIGGGLTNSGTLLGNSMGVNAGTVSLANNAIISTLGNLTLTANTLSFGGTTSRIVAATSGAGTATITLANGFTNPGAIHSGATLNFSAPWINNSSTGGFSALGTLNLNATAGDLYNAGALYAGNQLNASTTGTLTNVASTGTIDSSGSMSLSAATFLNNYHVNATNNIMISATMFRNETPGGDTRQWTGVLNDSGTIELFYSGKGYHGCGCVDQTEWWDYKQTWNVDQYYAGTVPTIKPQIIGGGTVTIQNFTSGTNLAGFITGGTLNLIGTGTFTNDDLSLQRKNHTKTWTRHIDYIAAGPAKYHDETRNLNESFTTSTISSTGAGLFANTLNASGFSLVVKGSPYAASVTSTSSTGATGTTATSGASSVSFGGLVIALPTNPNGYFVVSQNPNSQYLVETNSLFNVGANFVGSDYMANRYGYNPDTIIKRLGDANYEAYLIKQQLINQIGKNILNGFQNEAGQMKGLWDQSVSEGKRLGLTFGKPLSESQITNLKEDVVWMVETTIAGQKVLAPVVYLAASTKNGVEKGSVIAAKDINMGLKSVSNTGGTISGSNTLNITSQGDITNTSGTIKGGNVTIKSTEGSINNKTLVEGSGGDRQYVTTVGKTAGITATGNLDLNAKQDITVKGGDVKAGGNVTLDAGNNIRFETVVNKTTNTTSSKSGNALLGSIETTTTTTEKNIGSNLESGGNVTLKSGGDTTVKGSNVKAGGDLDVNTGGDFKVLSVQDKTTTREVKTTSGLGVGGGLAGTEKKTTDDFVGKNAGSTVSVGGNATVKSAGAMTLQGSDMNIKGDADIDAKKGINVLDGLDERRTTIKTETTTFLKTGSSGEASSGSGTESGTKTGQGYAKASGKASAGAEASGQSDLKFSETTTTVTKSGSNTSVSSNLNVGGNLKAKTDGTMKVQGSNVEAGGGLDVDARNIDVTAGRNEAWSKTTTDRVSTGIFSEGGAKAGASAEGQAKGGTVGNGGSGNASAEAEASGTTTVGVRVEKEESTSYKLTNTGSTLKSGGNMNLKAKQDVTFVGSTAESGGDMNIDATNITNKAAQNVEITTESATRHTAGFYVDGKVSAEAKADASVGRPGQGLAVGEVGAGAKADVSAGVRYKNEQSSSVEGSVTQVTSGFKAGGNITRTAKDTITDQGTQIEAGGDINQKARVIREIEANDSTFSSKNSSSHDAKLGVGASASAGASGNSKGETEVDSGAGAGFRAKYAGEITDSKEGSTTAVTSKYKSGGNINSKSEEKTTLIGTQFESGGDVNLEASSLNFKAAKDTTTRSGTSHQIGAEVKVDVVGSKGGSLEASYAGSGENEKTSTARTGSINAGGNLNIKTKGDASFEGTQLESGGDASIKSGGTVDFKAARDTTESSSKSGSVSLELSGSKKSKGGALAAEYAQENSASSTSQAASVKSGGKMDISAGKDANFEGTELKSAGDTSVAAGGNVNFKAAKDTETGTAFGVSVGASGGSEKEKGKKTSKQAGEFGASVEHTDKVESTGTSIESGGAVSIKGKNVVNQEASIRGEGGTEVTGNVITQKAESRDIAIGLDVGVKGENVKETKIKSKPQKKQ